MCGIIGYSGQRDVAPLLIAGLKRMEYRGYDSAGIAVNNKDLRVVKDAGKVSNLEQLVRGASVKGNCGIGHTRWATHGAPNQTNAHPHTDEEQTIALAHNGIIENYSSLRHELGRTGHRFVTDTDTEVIAHLIEEFYEGDLPRAVLKALRVVRGTYGLAIVSKHHPGMVVAARLGSPMVIGHGHGENFLASDPAAFLSMTRDVTYLEDGEIAVLTPERVEYRTLSDEPIDKKLEQITYDIAAIEKGGFAHFMLKEICEQPQTVADSMRGRLLPEEGAVKFGGMATAREILSDAKRVVFLGCGTSWHAGLVGEYLFEELAGIPCEVEYSSEFRYRSPILEPGTAVFAISQSGETADTLAAVREARRHGAPVFGVCNVVGSTIARETDAGVYIHAGPEIGVASTKAFTSQITVLFMLALQMGRSRRVGAGRGRELVQHLKDIPQKISRILATRERVETIAHHYRDSRNFLYLGRGLNFPVALEGALKLKEISYVHAEGYPAAEMKHGPIALIDRDMPVVFIATRDGTYEKVVSNIEEVRARGGRVLAIATEGDTEIQSRVDEVVYVPETDPLLTPLLTVVPLQLLAYYMAVHRGCDVDQPRNLAKSVTVE
ncbi:MAG: glutamine--fructose-6-phosphate transaminase (isomerizing) [Calditrichaeota bacterium]|nr:glutamine--fructose-6-phosphate transaminase (isomerizing) [Calditrichota bacterium]MCB9366344.1 glutamine--fructose-6-phosphate transaminase (isomerizing) [Calditrichota bacterium]